MRSEQLPSTPTQLDRISLVEQTISDDWANSSRVSIETSGREDATKATDSVTCFTSLFMFSKIPDYAGFVAQPLFWAVCCLCRSVFFA